MTPDQHGGGAARDGYGALWASLRRNPGTYRPDPGEWFPGAWSTSAVNLSVQVFIDREDGRRDMFDPPTDERGHAGFESWRETVWGSRRVKALGAVFFPRLATSDLYIEPGELDAFLNECAVLLDNLDGLVPGMDPLDRRAERRLDAVAEFRHTLAERLENIAAAARYALIVGGGVVIATSVAVSPPTDPPE